MSEHKTDRVDTFCLGMIIGVVIISACGIFLLRFEREDIIKKERQNAVKAGVARYVPDENGDPKFEYLPLSRKPESLNGQDLRQ